MVEGVLQGRDVELAHGEHGQRDALAARRIGVLQLGHELLGLSRLEKDLKDLEAEWPDGAYAMRVLLSGCGRMRQDGSMPSALVARLRAADQRSCENERARHEPLRAWRPKRWLSSFIPDNDPMPME